MQAPERAEAGTPPTAPTQPAIAGPSQRGADLLDGRAPRQREDASGSWQQSAQEPAPSDALRQESHDSSCGSDRGKSNSDGERESDDDADSDSGESSRSSASSAQSEASSEQNEAPDEPEPPLTQEAVAARFAKMFAVGAAAPVRSWVPAYAPPATRKLAKLVWAHCDGLKKDHVKALSQSFGNFDRVVGAGRLAADAMGTPLIDIELGLKVGLKVKYEGGKAVKTETSIRRDAQKAASRLPADDPKRRDLLSQAEKRVESHLGEPIELPLNAPTQAAAARASGSRKRARDPDREHEEQMAAAQSELLKLQKAVSRAETKAQHTTRTVEQKFKVLQRMSDRSLACPSATKAEAKRAKHLHACVQDALTALDDAIGAQHEAEVEHLEAQLAEKEAENEMLQSDRQYALDQWGDSLKSLEALEQAARAACTSV